MREALVNYAINNDVARIALNDPAKLNSMTEAMGEELLHALARAARDARAIVLTGEGKAFCAGANLDNAMNDLHLEAWDGGEQLERIFNPIIVSMRELPQPIITALRGVVAGVGCGIAMAGDIILCSETAYFFHAFSKVGLVPDGGSSWLLSKAIGRVRAMQLMLLGEKLPADKALDWGLVTKLVADEELDRLAMEMALGLASGPKSLAMIKRVAWQALEFDLETALTNERSYQREASRTEDFEEGVSAFAERRKPKFVGR